jgi:iron complex outermembrane receptor protein
VHGGFKKVNDNYQFNPAAVPNDNKSTLFQALGLYERNFFKTTYLTTGVQFQNRRIKSNDRGNHAVNQVATFAVLQQRIGTALNISPALRLDWDERSGTEWIPQLNVSYRIATFQLRGSAGKTIRQADFTERYNNYNKRVVSNLMRVGNPDLKAETSLSYEVGVDFFAGKAFKIATTYFQRDYDDLIDFTATPYSNMPRRENLSPAGTYFLAKNIATVVTRGFETDIVFSKRWDNRHQLFSTAGFVVLKSRSDTAAPSLYISSHATFLTNFTLNYTTPRWSVSLASLYKERNAQAAQAIKATVSKAYFVMHVKAEAFVVKEKWSVLVQVDNVLNRAYSDVLGAQMPQRWLMGGLKWTL